MECYSCKSNSGEKRISPGPTIYKGKYWKIEHAYPSKLIGWIVIVLNRHESALHNINLEEHKELAELVYKTTRYLKKLTSCVKEYCICLTEGEHFEHIHFHIVPRAENIDPEIKGSKIFKMLKPSKDEILPEKEIIEFCKKMKNLFEKDNP